MTVAPGRGAERSAAAVRPRARFRIERGDVARDREDVIALLQRNRPGQETRAARYTHLYERCPLGEPAFWVAREGDGGRVIGMFTVFPAPLRIDGELAGGGIEADFAVDEEHRGAFGPAIPLVRALNAGLDDLDVTLAWGFPNANSEPIVSALSCETIGRSDLFGKPLRLDLMLDWLGRMPKVLRPLARVLDPVLRVVSRDDRHRFRRRRRDLKLELPGSFDDRFESLWRDHRQRHRITGERNAELLNWRYGLEPEREDASYAVLAIVDRRNEVAAYAVVTEAGRRLQVVDLVSRPSAREIDLLLGHLIAYARRRRTAGIGFRYFGPETLMTRRLRSFGFVRRPAEGLLMVRACKPLPADLELGSRSPWYIVGGDSD